MSVPQSLLEVEPSERLRSLRKARHQRLHRSLQMAKFRSLGWEMTGRLTVNLVFSLISLSTLSRLIPYYQTQRQVLASMESSIVTAEEQTAQLRAEFSHYFDPSQMGRMVQELGGREPDLYIPVILVDKAKKPDPPTLSTTPGEDEPNNAPTTLETPASAEPVPASPEE